VVNDTVRRNIVRDAGVDGIGINLDHAGPVTDTLVEGNVLTGSGDDGIDVESPSTTLRGNVAVHNGDVGIEAVPGVADGGGNRAYANGSLLQCTNIHCTGRVGRGVDFVLKSLSSAEDPEVEAWIYARIAESLEKEMDQ
jgi:hypothetical protein